ncbi:MAG: 5-(carboxyamino)imidazole ribonucleotide mutase [Oscillospiraceae bacterium]|nr:5-(carboxyamino)imidazole ribonucleotide mutase [Oscillospiraceae bacterium]
MKKVAVIMGSQSDRPVVQRALDVLAWFGVPAEARVMSAHRTPQEAHDFAGCARAEGFGVLIAAAGKAAHLAGALAAVTALPVVGLPVKSSTLDGLDALLSTVQMPRGVPVATVTIDGAENAALLAVEILAVSDEALHTALLRYRAEMADEVRAADRALRAEEMSESCKKEL